MHVRAVLILALGAVASAQQFVDFPTSLTCKTGAGGKETATISKIEAQDAVKGPNGTKQDDSAANVASGKCVNLSGVPFYGGGVSGKGSIYFAYDKAKDTYYFCSAQGAVDESGWPSSCTEN
ncbi:hypothetical protein CaCOL14_002156 [Colletotrichum acutatum]|uniref:Uncharacterized protein n=1 Tax=Glomerella acutata TaxID=27357 RepID=A0AAD8XCV8_GLOAC|nr:uncharacterized protein BDZ83DRAFT_733247 [Colletotrichum acutatum]KAK1720135.1 hypothetical protein BDZ83DRAFT_733247 [Colletotrichum acutatum]